MTCFMGVDYGTKRIGLAVSDAEGTLASPLVTIETGGDVDHQIRAILKESEAYDVEVFVVGLPLNMDGSEGKQARITRVFGEKLAETSSTEVRYFDERLSSFCAKQTLIETGLSAKKRKARLDSAAARSLLQDFLDAERH